MMSVMSEFPSIRVDVHAHYIPPHHEAALDPAVAFLPLGDSVALAKECNVSHLDGLDALAQFPRFRRS